MSSEGVEQQRDRLEDVGAPRLELPEEGNEAPCHEGRRGGGAGDEGHESHEGYEGNEEGHEGHESYEGYEGDEEGHEGYESHEGHEGNEEVNGGSASICCSSAMDINDA